MVDNVEFLTTDLSAAEVKSIHSGSTSVSSVTGTSGFKSSAATSSTSTSNDSQSSSSGSFSYTMTADNTKVVLDGAAKRGIIDQEYLNGDTSWSFNVDIINSKSSANFKNALGAYEIDSKGNIVDVRIIDTNTTDTTDTIKVTGVNKGNDLGFFIVQDGYNRLDKVLGGNDLDLVVNKGSIYLTNSSGVLTKKVFVSHDKSLNYDNFQHVTSMDNPNSTGAIISFDDQHEGGRDRDMTDVVFEVTANGADELSFA